MNLYSEKAKWDNVKFDFDAVKFHALKYLMGNRTALATTSYQYVKQLEQSKNVVINLWGEGNDPAAKL
jgi:hypothetical protein